MDYNIKKNTGVTSRIAQCHNCEWKNQSQNYATSAARNHAKQTGHTVTVEVGSCTRYSKT